MSNKDNIVFLKSPIGIIDSNSFDLYNTVDKSLLSLCSIFSRVYIAVPPVADPQFYLLLP